MLALAESIRRGGVHEPLVVTADGWLLSGHRRREAARMAGLKVVPCHIRQDVSRTQDPDRFLRLLREYNLQRVKTRAEHLREEIVSADPAEAYRQLLEYREKQSAVSGECLALSSARRRKAITPAKGPMMEAVQRVLAERREFWPLSDRQIHYALLNAPPLIHANKPGRYENTKRAYKSLTDLLTRARLARLVPMSAIADETRPVTVWRTNKNVGAFIRRELGDFLKGYWRDAMQSQPRHVEIIAEKMTVGPILERVAGRYTIPLVIGRGYCSLAPRAELAERFRKSGKDRLVLLIVSDFDPDGEGIAECFARSMRDDFGIASVHAVKVALTGEQVQRFNLPPVMKAKRTSSRYAGFAARHGEDVFELEALPPAELQNLLTEAIEGVIDREALNHEQAEEQADATHLKSIRQRVHAGLRDVVEDDGA